MVRALDSQFRSPGKPVGGSKVDSVFHSRSIKLEPETPGDLVIKTSSQDLVDLSLETIESYS